MNNKGILVVVSGFSGAGKGTLMKELLSRYDNYALSISVTTRTPRPGEQEGVHYFYRTEEEFDQMVEQNAFIEYARYVKHSYGTPKTYVEQQLSAGKDVILEIELQGALQVKKSRPETLLLFVTPPSAQELRRRLVDRGSEEEDEINRRMARAVEESREMSSYDYIVVNDEVSSCVDDMHKIIQSYHTATGNQMELIKKMQKELKDMEEK
ncbi:MAG: guanylate kinase [Lachnospiraceae bacterium]|nr:guanylate kinase [Lachnospiraceae bacterium]